MENEEKYIVLNIEEQEVKHVTKEEILEFFQSLKSMPTIDKEVVYEDILNNKINLPKFKAETYFLNFFKYAVKEKELIVIQDFGSDCYYYIQDNQVFKTDRYEAQNKFYKEIALKTNQTHEFTHDTLIDKLNTYETIFLAKYNKHLSSLDDFIEDNIYMFDAALEGKKKVQEKVKMKIK